MAKKGLCLVFLAVYFMFFSCPKGLCSDLDDKIGSDSSIVKEDSISEKKLNKAYIKQQALSSAKKEARKKEKEADSYSTYEVKGPLGGTQHIQMKNEDSNKSQEKAQTVDTGAQGVGNVSVGAGAKTKDINIFVETKGDVTNVNVNK